MVIAGGGWPRRALLRKARAAAAWGGEQGAASGGCSGALGRAPLGTAAGGHAAVPVTLKSQSCNLSTLRPVWEP